MTRPVFIFLFAALCNMCLACAGPETRYKVLSFFFDGVPPPEREEEVKDTVAVEAAKPSEPRRKYVSHGPYAARLCDSCHRPGTNKLLLPIEVLCQNCHDLAISGRKVHGPISSGGCRVCHDPHGSGYPKLLVSDSRGFCLYCHEQAYVLAREVHREVSEECTVCHDAHSADNPYLLR